MKGVRFGNHITSRVHMLLSAPAEAMFLPEGLNAQVWTASVCPCNRVMGLGTVVVVLAKVVEGAAR